VKSTEPPPKEATVSVPGASEFEPHFQKMRVQLMTRWPTSNVSVMLGHMARTGLISRLPEWDIMNAGELPRLILDRLKDEAYQRELWVTIVLMRSNRTGCHLGNPRVEAQMATGLAIMDYIHEICPRLAYDDLLVRRAHDGSGY